MLLTSIVVVVMLLATLGTFLARRQSHDARSCSQRDPELELIDPNELLFSLPTINDGIPAVEIGAGIAGESGAIIMHEDDWRQAEFLPVANRGFIAETLSQLASHRAIHAEGPGFREVFVRTEPPVPLQTLHIESDELRGSSLLRVSRFIFKVPHWLACAEVLPRLYLMSGTCMDRKWMARSQRSESDSWGRELEASSEWLAFLGSMNFYSSTGFEG